jgi:hypothetical protein
MEGEIDEPSLEVVPIVREGVIGIEYQEQYFKADPSEIRTTAFFATAQLAKTGLGQYKNLTGTLQTVVDQRGITTVNIQILKVTHLETRAISGRSATENFVQHLIWTVQNANTS